jgi:hypothetical protein
MKELVLFSKANGEDMLPPLEGLDAEEAKKVADLKVKLQNFIKTYENTKGGCGCNREKRVENAKKQYGYFADSLRNCEVAATHVKSLLNSVEKIHFWKDGQRFRHQGKEGDPKFRPAEMPFAIV